MDIQAVVNEAKGRLETVGTTAQGVAEISLKTLKQANEIVIGNVQDLFKAHSETAKSLFDSAKAGFDKAVADGLKAVAADPVAYLPAGRDQLVAAFSETKTVVVKTGEELAKVIKSGYQKAAAKINGQPVKAKRTVKKTAKRAGTAAKRAAA